MKMLKRLWMFVLPVASLIFFLFFWLMPILSRFSSLAFSLIVLEPTITLSCSDVHPGRVHMHMHQAHPVTLACEKHEHTQKKN